MKGAVSPAPPHNLTAVILAVLCFVAVPVSAADDPDSPWPTLAERSREALAPLVPDDSAIAETSPYMIVVGFTGGREGRDSRISGVVRLRERIEASLEGSSDVVAMTFNNRDWREAAAEVFALTEPASPRPLTRLRDAADSDPRPLIVAYGHSWGAGAVTKFARLLGERDLDLALAVYIDAFSLRNPRVPVNVRYAVNLYQRTGIFRGFPLRGKSKLVLESPESTTVLANLQITPDTDHFGWHWNLIQPLLYRHHHRMGHDVRLQQYLLDIVTMVLGPDPEEPNRLDGFAGYDGPAIDFLAATQTLEPID